MGVRHQLPAHAQLLDFNPVENVWSIMKHRIATFEQPKNRTELRTAIWKVWNALTDAELRPYFRAPAVFPNDMYEAVRQGGREGGVVDTLPTGFHLPGHGQCAV